jgi:hypothetical protein
MTQETWRNAVRAVFVYILVVKVLGWAAFWSFILLLILGFVFLDNESETIHWRAGD